MKKLITKFCRIYCIAGFLITIMLVACSIYLYDKYILSLELALTIALSSMMFYGICLIKTILGSDAFQEELLTIGLEQMLEETEKTIKIEKHSISILT